ncbi:unnamed protein product [Caretta caretta]
MAWNIAHAKHPYCDGEFVKKNIAEVVAILDPSNKKLQQLLQQIPIPCHTMERRISQISADVASKMQNNLKNSLAFSLAVNQSTDIQDEQEVAIFIHYVPGDVIIKEEMLDLVTLKETTHNVDIKNTLDKALTNANVLLDKLVVTDGSPAVGGEGIGLIGLLKSDSKFPEFLPVHCIIHHEHLTGRHFKYENLMKTVLKIVNFICSNGKTH